MRDRSAGLPMRGSQTAGLTSEQNRSGRVGVSLLARAIRWATRSGGNVGRRDKSAIKKKTRVFPVSLWFPCAPSPRPTSGRKDTTAAQSPVAC
jgi:hypothetical protein